MERGLRHRAHGYRWTIGVALQPHQPARRFNGHFRGRGVGKRSRGAEGGDGHVDEPRTFPKEVPAPPGFDKHIRIAEKRRWIVGDDTLLARAHARPIQRLVAIERTQAAGLATLGRLDLYDLGPEFGQHLAGEFAPARGGVDDADAVEWWGHASVLGPGLGNNGP